MIKLEEFLFISEYIWLKTTTNTVTKPIKNEISSLIKTLNVLNETVLKQDKVLNHHKHLVIPNK